MTKSRTYIITWNNYTSEDLDYWKQHIQDKCDQWAWQLEEGEDAKTPHIQGALYYKSCRTFSSVKKDLPKCHIEETRSWTAASKYCQKVSTRIADGGQGDVHITRRDKEDKTIQVKDPMEGLIKHPWQIKIEEMLSQPPPERKIFWYYDKNGSVGKTTFAKHLAIKHSPNFIYLSGKASDIKSGITTMVSGGNNPDICIFDYTRTSESYISYEAIESVKNGIFYSGKYESSMVIFNTPHVIIFANFMPQLTALSADRWVIEDLTIKNV